MTVLILVADFAVFFLTSFPVEKLRATPICDDFREDNNEKM